MRIHPFRNPAFFSLLAVGALIFSSSNARATNRTVTSLADGGTGTLRDAIMASDDGDSIDFSVTGSINLTSGTLTISNGIMITGPGANLLEVTRSAGVFQIFDVSGHGVTISGIGITNGHATGSFDGGGIGNRGILTVSNCIISGNTDTGGDGDVSVGGGIFNNGTLTLNGCVISGNSATDYGGGIQNEFGGTLTVNNCVISGNTAHFGGGISNGPYLGSAVLVLRNSAVSGNTAGSGGGGGIFNSRDATISNCTLNDNTASTGGGAIDNDTVLGGNPALTLRNCTLTNNTAPAGGGILNHGSDNLRANVTVSNSTLAGNSASNGGGIYNTGVSGGNAFVMLDNSILQTGAAGANLVNVGDGTSITSQGYNLSSSTPIPNWAHCRTTAAPPSP
jgi:hypothetical protein